jgi:hypothetical protein
MVAGVQWYKATDRFHRVLSGDIDRQISQRTILTTIFIIFG